VVLRSLMQPDLLGAGTAFRALAAYAAVCVDVLRTAMASQA
jgi:hypothetical protein